MQRKLFLQISTPTVDKLVNKPHLTAENACNDAGFNKLPILEAVFSLNKIKYLAHPSEYLRHAGTGFIKYFFVYKSEAGDIVSLAHAKSLTNLTARNSVSLRTAILSSTHRGIDA